MNSRRRNFIAIGLGVLLASRMVAAQQTAKVHRVAFLDWKSPSRGLPYFDALKKAMVARGYVEGRQIEFDVRWAEGNYERLSLLANELVSLKPDVIVCVTPPAVAAAKRATAAIPIVMAGVGDPIRLGFVTSLSRPSGNITGLSGVIGNDLSLKVVQIIHTVVPKATRIAYLFGVNTDPDIHRQWATELQSGAKPLGVSILPMGVDTLAGIKRAFVSMAKERAGAVFVQSYTILALHRMEIIQLAAAAKIPVFYTSPESVEAGGLLSYGEKDTPSQTPVASYVDKILRGAKPADLPVQQPTEFELVINMKTAKALGITIPQEILLRADKLIE